MERIRRSRPRVVGACDRSAPAGRRKSTGAGYSARRRARSGDRRWCSRSTRWSFGPAPRRCLSSGALPDHCGCERRGHDDGDRGDHGRRDGVRPCGDALFDRPVRMIGVVIGGRRARRCGRVRCTGVRCVVRCGVGGDGLLLCQRAVRVPVRHRERGRRKRRRETGRTEHETHRHRVSHRMRTLPEHVGGRNPCAVRSRRGSDPRSPSCAVPRRCRTRT